MEFADLRREDLIRPDFDEECMSFETWDFLAGSPFLKEGYQSGYAKEEILRAYITSVRVLANAFYERSHPGHGQFVIYSDQSYIPLLFLCRHGIELAIKYTYGALGLREPMGHRILELWRGVEPQLHLPPEERDGIRCFLKVIDLLDRDGCHMRYATDRSDEPYQKSPVYIRIGAIVDLTIRLTTALLEKRWM